VPGAGHPSSKPLLDKLGVKPGDRIAVLGLDDPAFLQELQTRTDDVSRGRPKMGSKLIFVLIEHRDGLDRVAPLQRYLRPDGAIWVIRPKGTPDIKEVDVIEAGKRAGLVDNKIASFSDRLSAMRLVIPIALR
jgi:hypothetical protein